MKKLKKLLAVVLACAMALSLCATALAEENTPTVTSWEQEDLGDSIDAQSITQGGLPAKPINVILPTVPERTADQLGYFDFYLDPHELITKTEAARYSDYTFAPDTRLYFASGEDAYSNTSQSLTVTNVGFVDVNVDLDLVFDRGGADFKLVSSPSAFSENAAEDVPAEMYLAVVGGGQTKAVLDPSIPPSAVIDTSEDAANYLSANSEVKFEYPTFKVSDYSKYATAAAKEQALVVNEEMKEALETALKVAELTFEYTAGIPADNSDPDNPVAAVPAQIEVGLTATDEEHANLLADFDFVTKTGNTTVDDATFTGTGTKSVTAEIRYTDDETVDDEEIDVLLAKLSFTLAFPAAATAEDGTQTITFNVPHTGAKIETALGVLENSYKLSQTDSPDDLLASGLDVTPNGYYWEQTEPDTEAYPAFSFHLVGDINEALNTDDDTSPWDDITNDEEDGITAIGFTLTWDVSPYDKTEGRTKLTTPAGVEEEVSSEPTVVVKTKASGTSTTNKTATLTWTAGTGTYAAYQPVSARNSKGSFSGTSFSVSGNTITLIASTTLKADTNCVITFSDGTNSVDVNVTGWFGT